MAISVASVPAHPFLLDSEKIPPRHSMWHRWGEHLGRWLGKDDSNACSEARDYFDPQGKEGKEEKPTLKRRWSKRVGLPRAPTFKRQNSERRINLEPVEQGHTERRAASLMADHRRTLSVQRTRSPQPVSGPRLSAPEVRRYDNENASLPTMSGEKNSTFQSEEADEDPLVGPDYPVRRLDSAVFTDADSTRDIDDEDMLEIELDRKWILNLSMHFRDKSDREKFFVTYAQTPTLWRRVTVSCDYRGAEPDSLEKDLKELQFQRDKSARIYESIRESLSEIQFYPTVTNLKLQTSEGRLHVHVTEDVNEIIPYPSKTALQHLEVPDHIQGRNMYVRESDLEFDTHLSGFVYKVRYGGHDFIKKEIPGPDTVDEFLYEINALHALSDSESVIKFEGVIVDDNEQVVKGLLISYAEMGALVDILYDYKGSLDWPRRERWAKQIVQGLMEIHEAGYVQGDFTLSNIVVDSEDKAKIIDINRRGCPVGWEPPEISKKIESNQRISMYIGVKSDMFQLGMTLWALAMDEDEPERQDRPLRMDEADPGVHPYYRKLVDLCLADRPQDRPSAKDLLAMFPNLEESQAQEERDSHSRSLSSRAYKQYIDPSQAVEREDIDRELLARQMRHQEQEVESTDQPSYINPTDSSDLQFESSGSYVVGRRGRSPPRNIEHLSRRERRAGISGSEYSTESDSEPQIIGISPTHGHDYDEVNLDGIPFLVARNTFHEHDLRVLQAHENPSTNEVVEIDPSPQTDHKEEIHEMTEPLTEDSSFADVHPSYAPNEGEDPQQSLQDEVHSPPDEDIDLESSKMDDLIFHLPLSLSERTLTPAAANNAGPASSLEDSLTGDLACVGGHITLDDCGPQGGSDCSKAVEEEWEESAPEPVLVDDSKDNPTPESSSEPHFLQDAEPAIPDQSPPLLSLELSENPQSIDPEAELKKPDFPEPESSAEPALSNSLFASAHSQLPPSEANHTQEEQPAQPPAQ
jgi:serine/threonine protein kinase